MATLAAAQPAGGRPASGLPVPRFVSLKSDRVNMRKGPGTDYPTAWVYRRAGLPLEVIKEFEGWRQVRDADGAARLGAAVLPARAGGLRWSALGGEARHAGAQSGAAPRRQRAGPCRRDGRGRRHRQPGVVRRALVPASTSISSSGYIEQKKFWGVYEGEVIN